jgi:pyruvate-ferredoxin/flavodoxin oxidoreductase
MDRFAALTGRRYRLFDYVGHPDAERVVVMMGSGAECAHETVDALVGAGERVGLVKVRLYRPFAMDAFIAALPASVRSVAVLDRTKEPGATGEPLLLDVTAALADAVTTGARDRLPRIIGGRYGLGSKELTPAMVKAVFDEAGAEAPRTRFSVGITDDVTGLSLPVDDSFDAEPPGVTRAVFYGLGSDGTVSANKATIRIIGDATGHACQGYFVLDSKKAGSATVSHLRFGPAPIRSTYQIRRAGFVAVHDPAFVDRLDVLERADTGATVLLNTPVPAGEVWAGLPREAQATLLERGCRLFAIDAYRLAETHGLGRRINTIMQACFFALSDVLPIGEAIARMKDAVSATWGRRGPEVVRRNTAAIDDAVAALHEVPVPTVVDASSARRPAVPDDAPEFVQRVTRLLLEGHGDRAPGQRLPARRHLADGDQPLREAGHRLGPADLGAGSVRAVQPLLDDLPARRHPHQGLRPRRRRRRAAIVPFRPRGLHPRARRARVHRAGRPRRLHRLRAVRRGVPGQGPHPTAAQGSQPETGRGAPVRRAGGVRVLPSAP